MATITETAEEDPRKYIVSRFDFRRLARWPNDGISQNQCREHIELNTDDPDQRDLTKLFGGWMFSKTLTELERENNELPYRDLPWLMQVKSAQNMADEEAAIDHIIKEYDDSNVQALLIEIGCKKAIRKTVRTRSRFPGFMVILAPLFRKNLATQSNIRLLFGDEMRIMHHIMEVGANVAQAPPQGTGAADTWTETLHQSGQVGAVKCGECEATDANRSFSKCASCKSIYYCSRACQEKNWKLHKPDCLTKQGKPVPEKARLGAEKEAQRRRDKETKQIDDENQVRGLKAKADLEKFINEHEDLVDTFSKSGTGDHLRSHLLPDMTMVVHFVAKVHGAEYAERLTFAGYYPPGVPRSEPRRGLLFRRQSDGAPFFLLHHRLFHNETLNGNHVAGFWVVDSIQKGKARWRKVPTPRYHPTENRFQRFVTYFQEVLRHVQKVDAGVDLGIQNSGERFESYISQKFGR